MRLIDADELMEHVWRDKLDSRELIAGMIEKAPTVKEITIRIPLPSSMNRYDDDDPETWPEDGSWSLWQHKSGAMNVLRWKMDALNHFFPNPYDWDIDDVVAWMPLPERYKTESEG